MTEPAARPKLVLIDGFHNIFRAFYAIRSLSNSKGVPTNAVYGFVQTLRKILRDEKPDFIGVALDLSDQTFRTEVEFGREEIPAAALVGEAKWYVKNAVDAAYDGTDPEAAARCDADTLDPAKSEGFAIICVRGNLFSDNANQVAAVGGTALIVRDQYERGPATTVTSQAVPVVHVSYEDGLALAEWVDSKSNPRIEVETSELDYVNAPSMAAFSSCRP